MWGWILLLALAVVYWAVTSMLRLLPSDWNITYFEPSLTQMYAAPFLCMWIVAAFMATDTFGRLAEMQAKTEAETASNK